eukprot:g1450.t1
MSSSTSTSSSSSSASSSASSGMWMGEEESKGGGQDQGSVAEEFVKPLEEPVQAGTVTTLAGSGERGSEDEAGDSASFHNPRGLALSPDGELLFIADAGNHKIRIMNMNTGAVTTLAGSGEEGSEDGVGVAASFCHPSGLAVSPDGKQLFVADIDGNKIRVVNVADGTVTTLAGSGEEGSEDGVGAAASFSGPPGLALSLDGKQLFVADYHGNKIRVVNVADGTVTTLAGSGQYKSEDGVGAAASFKYPEGLTLSPDGKQLFVADQDGHNIRVVNVADGTVTTLAGSGEDGSEDGVGAAAYFSYPTDLALSPDGKQLFVSEYCGNKIRVVNVADGTVTTLAGSGEDKSEDGVGTAASFNIPHGLAIDHRSNQLLITEHSGHKIRAVQLVAIGPQPPIVIPPSTLLDDLKKTMAGDPNLPMGFATFIVGPERKRFELIAKPILCVRSEYFDRLFRNAMAEGSSGGGGGGGAAAGGAATAVSKIEVPDTDPASFQTLLDYITTDQVAFPGGAQHAFSTLQLARKHGVVRLERLCLQALEDEQLTAESAVPLLEAAQAVGGGADEGGAAAGGGGGNRLFDTCRRFILDHGKAVKDAGGLEQLQEHAPVTKGLLGDSIEEVRRLRDEVERLGGGSGGTGGGGGSRKRRRAE